MLVNIASDDASVLAILSSTLHVRWALVRGGTLEDRPRYNKSVCFETFPFPDLDAEPALRDKLRELGEKLDAHRKARQAEHPELTLTGVYNVLEKLRRGKSLDEKEKVIHDQGLVSLLKQIHDEIDRVVLEAYRRRGFQPLSLNDEKRQDASSTPIADRLARGDEELEQAILQHLVDLNHKRAAEEAAGIIRYLRPDFQDPRNTQAEVSQKGLDLPKAKAAVATAKVGKMTWPKELPAKVALVLELLPETGNDSEALDRVFGRASQKRRTEIEEVLTTLKALGQI